MIADRVANHFGISLEFVKRVAATANYRYKSYSIPKKNGGQRQIEHPARELKLLQRWLNEFVFCHLPIHLAASAYKVGSSIRGNAMRHLNQKYLLRMDFANFFPSLSATDVTRLIRENRTLLDRTPLSDEDIQLITKLVCRKGALTIGAPTSPVLSNALMFQFDEYWSTVARTHGIAYSRYADDLYFSTNTPGLLSSIPPDIRSYVSHHKSPLLFVNSEKTVFTSQKRRRMVTGLILTSDRQISLGRERKRFIKSLVYKYKNQQLDEKATDSLRGLISFARSIEPSFFASLSQKYSEALAQLIAPPERKKTAAKAAGAN